MSTGGKLYKVTITFRGGSSQEYNVHDKKILEDYDNGVKEGKYKIYEFEAGCPCGMSRSVGS
jgi:hypothetical protein